MSQNMLMGMEASMRDKEVQVAHLMACVYDEQNRTQVRSTNCHTQPTPSTLGPDAVLEHPTRSLTVPGLPSKWPLPVTAAW